MRLLERGRPDRSASILGPKRLVLFGVLLALGLAAAFAALAMDTSVARSSGRVHRERANRRGDLGRLHPRQVVRAGRRAAAAAVRRLREGGRQGRPERRRRDLVHGGRRQRHLRRAAEYAPLPTRDRVRPLRGHARDRRRAARAAVRPEPARLRPRRGRHTGEPGSERVAATGRRRPLSTRKDRPPPRPGFGRRPGVPEKEEGR
jgi:hypothetical protein